MKQTFVGKAAFYFETGMEGIAWIVQPDDVTSISAASPASDIKYRFSHIFICSAGTRLVDLALKFCDEMSRCVGVVMQCPVF